MGHHLSLTSFKIKRPEKIRWVFPSSCPHILDCIPSKSLRQSLKKTSQILSEHNIEYRYVSLNQELFDEWFALYQKKTTQYGYQQMISKNWFEESKVLGKIVEGLFLYKYSKLYTGAVIVRYGLERGMLAYSAREHLSLGHGSNMSLGAIVDYLFLCKMKEINVESISSGKSRNAFGVYNRFGYLEFKLRMGYVPRRLADEIELDDVPLSADGTVLFFGQAEGKLHLYGCRPKGSNLLSDISAYHLQNTNFLLLEY